MDKALTRPLGVLARPGCGRSALGLLTVIWLLIGASTLNAGEPVFIDINANARSDMRTEGWASWIPDGGGGTFSLGEITVTIRPARGRLFSRSVKALLVHGLSVGADAIVCETLDETRPELELSITGLAPGPHSLATFHHAFGEELTYILTYQDQERDRIATVEGPTHNDQLPSLFTTFRAETNEPVVFRLSSTDSNPLYLSGLSLDGSNPSRRASEPYPANFDRHVDGDRGRVRLEWRPAPQSRSHRLRVAWDRDPEKALRRLTSTESHSSVLDVSVPGNAYDLPVGNDSLLHYFWRVDSVDGSGLIVPGRVWRFRARHLAFPSAEGYGRFALGGRGGRALHVTNLNDSGPGSLRAAVEATGPRTVVFDVSGIIKLESKLVFREANEFLTIAGHTAPGKGICLRNYSFGGLGARDVIIRHMRLRLGDTTGETMDGMGLAGSDHCIIDHCSISWSIDEGFSSRGAKNITFQRSIISEALNIAGHRKYEDGAGHGYAGSIGGDVGSFHHNLLAHNAGRNWSLAGATDQANRHAGRLDIRNMVVYNWAHRTTDGGAREVQFVNNYYKPGPASRIRTYLNPQFENPAFGPQQYYVRGNVVDGIVGPEGPTPPFGGMRIRGQQNAPVTVPVPFFPSYVRTHRPEEVFENVLADVGCTVPEQDQHDQRIVREAREGTATYQGSRSGLWGLPDSQDDVGGWEEYPEFRRPLDWDVDQDGLPDHWERQRGLDPLDPLDGVEDPDQDGYTNLEDYLNQLAGDGP